MSHEVAPGRSATGEAATGEAATGEAATGEAGPAGGPAPDARLCTFHVDHLLVGIEVGRVQEVVRHQATTPVPLAPAAVEGLINLRGQIVTAIDLRRLLALAPRPQDVRPMHAVVRLEGEAISLLVDRPGEVVEPQADGFGPVPATAPARLREVFSGACTLAHGLLLVLDPARLIELEPASRDARRSA